ncbi:MAG: alanine dehydrogenase [Anaerolineae bacterium]
MNIGVPKERRKSEYRIGLTPTRVQLLANAGHQVFVERGAGVGAGHHDDHYVRAGARIVYSGDELYGRSDLVVKVARPTAEELDWLRPGQGVMAFWHLASAAHAKIEKLVDARITVIAYEMIQTDDGRLPALRPMSEIAGRMSAHVAATLLQNDHGGKGVLLGGLPGVAPAEVVILGAGTTGLNAARAFVGLGATVYMLDRDLDQLERVYLHDNRIITMVAHPHNIEKVCRFADVLIGAVLVPGQRTPVLVTRRQVSEMRRRSVIIDVDIDMGGSIETARPTSHETPTYLVDDVIHYCVPNMAGALGRTGTHALNNAIWPFVQMLADNGITNTINDSMTVARGVAMHDGQIVSPALRAENPS